MKRIAKLLLRAVVVLLTVITFGALALRAWHFELSEPGTSAESWEYLCGVQLPEFKGHYQYSRFGGAYPVVDGKAHYYSQMQHGSLLYSVSLEDVLHDLPRVQEHLANPQPPSSSNCVGYDSLCELYKRSSERRSQCVAILGAAKAETMSPSELEELRLRIVQAATFPRYDKLEDEEFRGRVDRGKRVWVTFAFETIYLGGWLMFVTGVRFLRVRWYWRVGLGPFLLFLPYFLGYAPMTFTFGPSGGFVYPLYLILASLPMQIVPCSALDGFVWQLLPNLLQGLSQMPGSPLAVTRMACVGPVSSLGFGIVLLAGFFAVIQIRGRYRREGRSATILVL